jgi:hypothetical protein
MNKIEEIAGTITSVMFNGNHNVSVNTDQGFQMLLFMFCSPLYPAVKSCRVEQMKQESSEYCYVPASFEGDSGKWFKGNLIANKSPKETKVMNVAKKLNKYLLSLESREIQELKDDLRQGETISFIGHVTVIKK